MPAVAFGVTGRFGLSGDDFGGFQDSTPEDGFADFGVGSYLAVSRSFGELLALHGLIGLSASKKLDLKTTMGVALEWSLVPETLVVVGDYATRRDIAGFEYTETADRVTFGVRYRLASGTTVQVLTAPAGHLLFSFAYLGERVEPIAPPLPEADDLTF